MVVRARGVRVCGYDCGGRVAVVGTPACLLSIWKVLENGKALAAANGIVSMVTFSATLLTM